MKKIPFFCLALLSLLPPMRSLHADDTKRALPVANNPTMAYYTKSGRIVYYGYTGYRKQVLPYSSILATNPVYARRQYQDPTMAFYGKGKTVYYSYTTYLTAQSARRLSWHYFVPPEQQTARFQRTPVSLAPNWIAQPTEATSSVRMRASPALNRETFEQESERTRGNAEENRAAMESSPVDAAGFYKQGNAYKESQDYWKAIQDYDEVIKLDPQNAYAYYKRGLCYSALDRMDLASENFLRANEIMADQDRPWSQKPHSWYPQSGY